MGDENLYFKGSGPGRNDPSGPIAKQAAIPELTPEEKDAVMETKAMVEQFAPEIIPFIKDLHKEGMILGWRSVGFSCLREK